MAVFLKIETGSQAGRAHRVAPGGKLRVGRTEMADIVVSDDTTMSRVHFELSFDGSSCALHDMQSTNGTQLNGSKVATGQLRDGDLISAGATRFSVHFETESRAEVSPPLPELPQNGSKTKKLLEMLRRQSQPTYAVLDAARDPAIMQILLASKQQYFWLFEGESSARLVHFAPYLVPLSADSSLLGTLLSEGWGKSWGIYLGSRADVTQVQEYLRWLLTATLPDGTDAVLRFYDPRILSALIESADATQLDQLFGPTSFYVLESNELMSATVFSRADQKLMTTLVPLDGEKTPETKATEPLTSATPAWKQISSRFMLSADQTKLLDARKRNTAQEALLEILRTESPERFARITEERMKAVVAYGCKRSSIYGIRKEREICQYVGLMMRFGPYFDADPNFPWASRLLKMRLAPSEKLRRLLQAAETHVEELARAEPRTQLFYR